MLLTVTYQSMKNQYWISGDSKLYVRSIETGEPKVLEVSPEPNSDEEDSKSSARPKASPIPTDDEDDEGLADDEEQDEENPNINSEK